MYYQRRQIENILAQQNRRNQRLVYRKAGSVAHAGNPPEVVYRQSDKSCRNKVKYHSVECLKGLLLCIINLKKYP